MACILLVLLCASWLSNARLHPQGGVVEVNGISSTKANVTTAIDGKNESVNSPSRSSFHGKRSLRTHLSDDSGFVAFTTDYHPPRHHPPKNNK
ncbi:hypothetical protein MTR_8g066030 [Medicago truncatula]|nr:hypothetical protein MTR_8g066030 [Medicago truncatula]